MLVYGVPYIPQADRIRLLPPDGKQPPESVLDLADPCIPRTAGELNYLITMRIKKEFTEKGKSYALFNEIIADLDDAKMAIKQGIKLDGFAGELIDLAYTFIFETDKLDKDIVLPDSVEEQEKIGQRLISASGALECAKLEFYRRVVSKYEDQKILDNGDVYE